MRAWVRERERERERVEESGDLDYRRISVGGIRFFRGRLHKYHVLSPTKEWESERAERCENKGSMSQREREWGEKDMSNMPHTVCPFTSLCLVPMTNAFFESLSLHPNFSLLPFSLPLSLTLSLSLSCSLTEPAANNRSLTLASLVKMNFSRVLNRIPQTVLSSEIKIWASESIENFKLEK